MGFPLRCCSCIRFLVFDGLVEGSELSRKCQDPLAMVALLLFVKSSDNGPLSFSLPHRLKQRIVSFHPTMAFKSLLSHILLVALLVSLCLPTVNAVGMSHKLRLIDILNQADGATFTADSVDADDVQQFTVEQRLDHFHPSSQKFQQRYFYSDRYVKPTADKENAKKGSVTETPTFAFLCVGGEGPSLTKAVLVDSVHCSGDMLELAKQVHEQYQASVHLFALEHRYYGKSYPGKISC